MKKWAKHLSLATFIAANCLLLSRALADTTLSTFENFNLDGLFSSWSTATVVSTPTNFSVSASGFGSGYKGLNPTVDATGETSLELVVTLSGTAAPGAPISGPIVSLVDADGTFYNYAWYGQSAGTHILHTNVNAPTFISAAGSVPGLDLSKLAFFHLQDDPGTYRGQYTITFQLLHLTGAPGLSVVSQSYDSTSQQFTLTWNSRTGMSYAVLFTSDLSIAFGTLVSGIPSGGNFTTATISLPTGQSGFLRIAQE